MNIKTMLTSLVLVISYVISLAQPLQNVYQASFFTFSQEVVALDDGTYLVGGQNGWFMGYPSFAPYLMRVDSSGEILFQRELQDHWTSELGGVNDIVVNPVDSSIYVAVEVSGCDYGVPGAFYNLDLNGNTLWFQEIFYADALALFSDGSVVVGGRFMDAIRRYAVSGDLIWESDLDFWVSDLVTINDTIYALGNESLLQIDADGMVLDSWTIPEGMGEELGYWGGQEVVVVRTATRLYLLDNDLNILDQSGLELLGQFESMKFAPDFCYLSGRNLDDGRIILSLDSNLNYVQEFSVGSAYQIVTNFDVTEEAIIVVGDETPDPYVGEANTSMWQRPYQHRGSGLFLETYDLQGNAATLKTDAAITDVGLEQITGFTANGTCFFPEAEAYSFGLVNIRVKVSNEGAEVLNAVNLNIRFDPCAFICPTASTYSRSFDNLNLQPGQTTELSFGNIDVLYLPLDNTNGVELCVWTSLANGQLDAQPENNEFCEFFIMTNTHETLSEAIKVFPNPAHDQLFIEGWKDIGTIQELWISNHLGQRILQPTLNLNHLIMVEIDELLPGGYFLIIQTEAGQFAKRFVKI